MNDSKLVKNQNLKKVISNVTHPDYGQVDLIINIRYDDRCGNGYNSFAITGDLYVAGRRGDRNLIACGCIHDQIKLLAPEYSHLIKWHCMNSDGPMHYLANSLYHASDKDHNGYKKGEPCSFEKHIKFEGMPITFSPSNKLIKWIEERKNNGLGFDVEVIELTHDNNDGYAYRPKYTIGDYPATKWHEGPFDSEQKAFEWIETLQTIPFEIVSLPTAYSEGKEPDLESARNCAIWPEAQLEDFTKENLVKRLPTLIDEFYDVVLSLGFEF